MSNSPASIVDDAEREYRAIEQTLLQNARGRWFLAEHGRRARRLDSVSLEDALSRLQSSLREPPALLGQLKSELEGLQGLLSATRAQAQLRAGAQDPGGGAPGTAQAILAAAEDLHEMAWALQSAPPGDEGAEQLARQVARLYAITMQHSQDSQRIRRLLAAIEDAGQRVAAVLETIRHETHTMEEPAPLPSPDPHLGTTSALIGGNRREG